MNDLLKYPFDSLEILRKYKSIRRTLIKNDNFIDVKIFVASGTTTDEIIKILEVFLLNAGLKPEFLQGNYGLFYEDLIFENKDLKDFNPDLIYVHTSFKNLKNIPKVSDNISDINQKLNDEFCNFKDIWEKIGENYGCPVIQNNFEMPPQRILGNLDSTHSNGLTNYINNLNVKFSRHANEDDNLYLNDINYLSAFHGIENWFSMKEWYRSKHSVSLRYIPYLSYNIANIISALYGKSKKGLVLDLDNTLWGGVIGDDGVSEIKIGNGSPVSEAHLDFQKYIKELHSRGIMLSIASKNDMKNALEGLNHPEGALSEKDFISIKANWSDKAGNIQEISKELNIHNDALVFIDDNPAERDLVKQFLPEINVLNVTDDISDYMDILDKSGFFEVTSISKDDINRNSTFEANKQRAKFEKKAVNYQEYLISLEMKSVIKESKGEQIERISQLINKTNQFNLTTFRHTAAEVTKFIESKDSIVIYGTLDDRFGENGIISVMVCNVFPEEIEIHIWVMSCRVFKRDMEFAMFDKLVDIAKKMNKKIIRGIFIPTKKNQLVSDLYETLGFTRTDSPKNRENEIHYVVDTKNIKQKNQSIKISNE